MPGRKIIYQNWLAEIGTEPDRIDPFGRGAPPAESNGKIVAAVSRAIGELPEKEQEFIRRYYYLGESYPEIALKMGRRLSLIDGLHRRAVAMLKKRLAEFVRVEYGVKVKTKPDCPVCKSPHRAEIDRLIREKDDRSTWKQIIRTLKDKYDVDIRTPQILIGHRKYHIIEG